MPTSVDDRARPNHDREHDVQRLQPQQHAGHLIEDQADVANAIGTGLGQGANAGNFTMANVAGASYAFGLRVWTMLRLREQSGHHRRVGFGLNADGLGFRRGSIR